MNATLITILLSIILVGISVVGDIFIKKASLLAGFEGWKLLSVGFFIYGATAVVWFFLMRRMKLSLLGIVYALSTAILMALLGVFYFKEDITTPEIIGVMLGIASLILLYKFSS